MSNWEATLLTAGQMQYAALDALIAGHVLRGLRMWHAQPAACAACSQLLGDVLPPHNLTYGPMLASLLLYYLAT